MEIICKFNMAVFKFPLHFDMFLISINMRNKNLGVKYNKQNLYLLKGFL